jgi:hypothetical protein
MDTPPPQFLCELCNDWHDVPADENDPYADHADCWEHHCALADAEHRLGL